MRDCSTEKNVVLPLYTSQFCALCMMRLSLFFIFESVLPGMQFTYIHYIPKHFDWVVWSLAMRLINREAPRRVFVR